MSIDSKSETLVRLTPPKLTRETLFGEVRCTRPMREGCFNLSTEVSAGKRVVHCYGHGGSGWTTLFGSVSRAIDLFIRSEKRSLPLRVVGAGCMGLVSAIELTRRGYKVAGITAKELYDTTSWKAAGYFALVSVKTSPEEQESLNAIGIETFKTFQEIALGKHPYLSSDCVRYLPVYCSQDTEAGVEELEIQGLIPPREEVTLDFGGGVRHPRYLKYMTYFMDTTKLMKQLFAEVKRAGIPIETRELSSFEEVEEEVVFNCSGLGARQLAGDHKLIPVRGHFLLLNELSGREHMEYMIYTVVEQAGRKEYIYLFPKAAAVSVSDPEGAPCFSALGGTFISPVDQLSERELAELDEREFEKLLTRSIRFFYG